MPVLEPHTLAYHSFSADDIAELRSDLLAWYHQHRRRLPWRGDPPPHGAAATCNVDAERTSSNSNDTQQQRDVKSSKRKRSSHGPMSRYLTSAASISAADDAGTAASASSAAAASAAVSQSPPPAAAPSAAPVSAYAVWVSEVMLQQTRVETVIDYYTRWMARFPTVASLASASLSEVNACWAGLGYYRRARLLHSGAQHVQAELGGRLPSTAASLLSIPGIGPYTAGAIASIAYSLPEPVVDGNVMRVICRLRAVDATVKHRQATRLAWELAAQLVQAGPQPGAFNQAVMELGATVCTPTSPRCADCPVNSSCRARAETQQSRRPIAAVRLHRGDSRRRGQIRMEEKEEEEETTETSITAGGQKAAQREEIDLDGDQSQGEVKAAQLTRGRVSRAGKRKRKSALSEQKAATLLLDDRRCDICDCSRERPPVSVCEYPAKAEKKRPLDEHVAVCVVSRAGRGGAGTEYLMMRRPDGGLLAGMWEFPSVICSPTPPSSAPSLQRRQQLLDSLLASALPAASLASCSQRRSVGSLVHVFSHRRHLMQVEAMTLLTAEAAEQREERTAGRQQRRERAHAWLTEEGMLRVGLTTGQRKVLQLLTTGGRRIAAAQQRSGRTMPEAEGQEQETEVEEDEDVEEEAEQAADEEEQEEWEVWPAPVPAANCAGRLPGDREVIVIDDT